MKQGHADRRVHEGKTEPKARAISEEGAAQIGVSTAFKKANLHKDRGYNAPKSERNCNYPAGTQGRH